MILSGIGIIADVLWYEIKNHAKDIELGEFVVMPNHVHGILILKGHERIDINIGQPVGDESGPRGDDVAVGKTHAAAGDGGDGGGVV